MPLTKLIFGVHAPRDPVTLTVTPPGGLASPPPDLVATRRDGFVTRTPFQTTRWSLTLSPGDHVVQLLLSKEQWFLGAITIDSASEAILVSRVPVDGKEKTIAWSTTATSAGSDPKDPWPPPVKELTIDDVSFAWFDGELTRLRKTLLTPRDGSPSGGGAGGPRGDLTEAVAEAPAGGGAPPSPPRSTTGRLDEALRRDARAAALRSLGRKPAGGFEAFDSVDPLVEHVLAEAAGEGADRKLVRNVVGKFNRGELPAWAELQGFEAIVMLEGRPVVDVRGGQFDEPPPPWASLATPPARALLERAIACVGRLEVVGSGLPYVGTAFRVGNGLVMTNRHVARMFASGVGRNGLTFRADRGAVTFVDDDGGRYPATSVAHVDPYWDMALLRVDGLAPGLELGLSKLTPEQAVGRSIAAIGYPARDGRNDGDEQDRIFRETYKTKRLAPGTIRAARRPAETPWGTIEALDHDCSTLGGNSGSPLIDVATGEVLGLHLGGRYLDANYACPASALRAALTAVGAETPQRSGAHALTRTAAGGGGDGAGVIGGGVDGGGAIGGGGGGAVSSTKVRVRVPIEIIVQVGAPVVVTDAEPVAPPAPAPIAPAGEATPATPATFRAVDELSRREAMRRFLTTGELPEATATITESFEGPIDPLWHQAVIDLQAELERDAEAVVARLREFYKEPDLSAADARDLIATMAEVVNRPDAVYDSLAASVEEGVGDKIKTGLRFMRDLVSYFPTRAPSAADRQAVAALQTAFGLDRDIDINPRDHHFETSDPRWWPLAWEKIEEKVGRWPAGLAPFRVHGQNGRSNYHYAGKPTDRIALLADFGTGLYHARHIARQLERWAYPDVFHLGDVYYGGSKSEFDDYFTAPLDPVLRGGSRVFGLAENHELYGEGKAYLDWLDRERGKNRIVQEGPYFCVRYPRHQVIGLDVNWNGRQRFRHAASREWLQDVIATGAGRTTILLTGSAPWEYGNVQPTALLGDIAETIALDKIDLWFWGDNHYCAVFEPKPGVVPFIGSCIGHGGYPGSLQRQGRKTYADAHWVESAARFPASHRLRDDIGNNGWCELTMLADGGVALLYVDWLGCKRYQVQYDRGANGRLTRTNDTPFGERSAATQYRP